MFIPYLTHDALIQPDGWGSKVSIALKKIAEMRNQRLTVHFLSRSHEPIRNIPKNDPAVRILIA